MGKLLLVSTIVGVFLGGSACDGSSDAIVDTPTPELSTSPTPTTPTPTVWPRLAEFKALAVKQCADLRSVAHADVTGIFQRLDLEAREANFETQGLGWQVRGTCRDAYDAAVALQPTATPHPTSAPAPPATPTAGGAGGTASSTAFKLAAIDANSKTPASDQVAAMAAVLRRLGSKCPQDSETRLGDYLVTGQSMLASRGKAMSIATLAGSVVGSIPASGYSGSCADVVAAFVTLTTNR